MDKATELLSRLDETLVCAHLDRSGKHRYALTVKSHPIIQAIKAHLAADACPHSMDRKSIMKQWDSWVKYYKAHGAGSWPRDAFESLLDEFEAQISQ